MVLDAGPELQPDGSGQQLGVLLIKGGDPTLLASVCASVQGFGSNVIGTHPADPGT